MEGVGTDYFYSGACLIEWGDEIIDSLADVTISEDGCYIITGGAIKLTRTMQEREHTLQELLRQEQVRNFLLTNQIIDTDSFIDYLTELK